MWRLRSGGGRGGRGGGRGGRGLVRMASWCWWIGRVLVVVLRLGIVGVILFQCGSTIVSAKKF